jgi:hypothetical protein
MPSYGWMTSHYPFPEMIGISTGLFTYLKNKMAQIERFKERLRMFGILKKVLLYEDREEIARRLQLHPSTVNKVIRGDIWDYHGVYHTAKEVALERIEKDRAKLTAVMKQIKGEI